MLHWGSVLLKQLYNLDLKFKENWPKNLPFRVGVLTMVLTVDSLTPNSLAVAA